MICFDRIPFWSSIKLVAIFWLVIPRFHGAYYAYQRLVRPFLVVNLQEAVDSLYKLKEEQTREKERFLDAVERYIKENGSEALEKVVAMKMYLKEPGDSQKDTQVIIEQDEKNVAAASKQLKEPGAAQNDIKKIAITDAKQYQHARPVTAVWVPKETTSYAAAKTKDVTPTEPISGNRHLTTTQKAEPEWTCPLCQVATTCERNLNDHLRGKKHKSMCESLKSSKLSGLDTGPSLTDNPSPDAGKNQVWRRIPEKNS
ncbi:hva22-like protein a [Phtheirospermum japonicum]|uniref:Hva22-like protein a n=1 Tax=Phtheirospermum japonicum TaxID=374723 RepID=A0A830BPC2_9LAMI|nr:hva22-like protein a [Phtheirospermum japonicum]